MTETSHNATGHAAPPSLWWCIVDGRTYGPCAVTQLKAIIQDGLINKETLVCLDGQDRWAPLSQWPQLSELHNRDGWYYKVGDVVEGPHSPAYLVALIRAGRIARTTEVRRNGSEFWQPISGITEFAIHLPSISEQLPSSVHSQAAHGGSDQASTFLNQLAASHQGTDVIAPSAAVAPSQVQPAMSSVESVETVATKSERLGSVSSSIPLLVYVVFPWIAFGAFPEPFQRDGVLVLAAFGTMAGGCLLFWLAKPVQFPARSQYAIGSFLFTAIAGIVSLLVFQTLATFAAEFPSHPRLRVLFVVQEIGRAYLESFSPSEPSLSKLAATFFSVGICEEVTKLLPVVALLGSSYGTYSDRHLGVREIVFIGGLSGLGFGIGEGFWYHWTEYGPGTPTSMYVLRFASIATGHALWTMAAAWALARVWSQHESQGERCHWKGKLGVVVIAAGPSALFHAVYNVYGTSFLPFGLVLAATSVVVVALLPVPNVSQRRNKLGRSSNNRRAKSLVWSVGATVVAIVLLMLLIGSVDRNDRDEGVDGGVSGDSMVYSLEALKDIWKNEGFELAVSDETDVIIVAYRDYTGRYIGVELFREISAYASRNVNCVGFTSKTTGRPITNSDMQMCYLWHQANLRAHEACAKATGGTVPNVVLGDKSNPPHVFSFEPGNDSTYGSKY